MQDQDESIQPDKNAIAIEQHRQTLTSIIGLLDKISTAVNEGFEKVNHRLSILEGKQGMQGVNTQLSEIKDELHKIQKTYPYEDMFKNLASIKNAEA